MTPEQVAEVLLVQAAEEAAPAALAPEARVDALEAAGELEEERAWFVRRARHLLDHALAGYRPLLSLRDALAPSAFWNLLLPALVGLSSNALGPHQQIHVLYNPIGLLVAWNLLAYGALAVWAAGARPRRARALRLRAIGAWPRAAERDAIAAGGGGWLARLVRRSAERLWLRALRASAPGRAEAAAWAAVGRRFAALWERAARPWFALRTRRMLHLAAVGLALGAIAGSYVRGLFFDYAMVWRSTFVREPESVARLLGSVLGPARALLGEGPVAAAEASALAAPDGVAAAPWIHALALTALLAIVLPRALLAAHASWRLRRLGPALAPSLEDPYFVGILAEARALRVSRLKEEIGSAVREQCARFADDLAGFVRAELFEARIVPELERFREEGGSVAALEAKIRAASAGFEPELAAHLQQAERDFEARLARDVLERVRPDLVLPPAAGRLGAAARDLPAASVREVGRDVSGELARDFAAAVSLAVGAVAGTLAGGFGTHLGVAILVTLLHTSGPIGFMIGALGGALVAAATLLAGRARVEGWVRGTPLPGPLVRLALRRARFDRIVANARERCAASVRALVSEKLEPLTDELADQVWGRVKPLLARATPLACPSPTEAS